MINVEMEKQASESPSRRLHKRKLYQKWKSAKKWRGDEDNDVAPKWKGDKDNDVAPRWKGGRYDKPKYVKTKKLNSKLSILCLS